MAQHTAALANLKSRHGVYFVNGNYEYYLSANAWITEVRRLGLKVLMNAHVILQHQGISMLVAGVTDYGEHHFDESHRSDPHLAIVETAIQRTTIGKTAIRDAKTKRCLTVQYGIKLLLAHQPLSAEAAADAGFDLQLSGHTHDGQFFLGICLYLCNNSILPAYTNCTIYGVYTSRETGYWGP